MPLAIHLLGLPRVERTSGDAYQVRSRKSWALLAYLLLTDRPPPRTELASLLYAEADDPLRALRWNLSEVRRALGDDVGLEGDPVVLDLPRGTVVDVHVLTRGSWPDAVRLPGLGSELLAGMALREAAAFSTWLLAAQRHLAAATEAILHEAALASLSQGRSDDAVAFASRATALNPLDENGQALLIRIYRLSGDVGAAQQQYEAVVELLDDELGVMPGEAIRRALREAPRRSGPAADPSVIAAVVEAGVAAIAAGAGQAGLDSLRAAVRMADELGDRRLRQNARLALAEALIHTHGGLDEEGLASLHEVDAIAAAAGDRETVALARAELGYVDLLRGRYERASRWLRESLAAAGDAVAITAKATTYLGSVASDRADYPGALRLFEAAVVLSRQAQDARRETYATSMIGRLHLLRGELDQAAHHLDAAVALATDDHWLAFLPWPQALRSSVHLAADDLSGATASSQQAFARACQVGDPCWEGIAGRSVALAAEANGETNRAFASLLDARERGTRSPDSYVWLDAYILDAMCEVGLRHGHPDTAAWVGRMRATTERTGMRELQVRALRHSAALGDPAAGEAAELLAADIANPLLASGTTTPS